MSSLSGAATRLSILNIRDPLATPSTASSLLTFATEKLAQRQALDLRREAVPTRRLANAWAQRGGRRLLSFSCNDYLNLSHHPALRAAADEATAEYGTGAGASYLVTGYHPLYARLEARLAALKGTASACVFGSGFLANAGIVPALMGEGDAIFVDELAHACVWAGARMSRATVVPFAHNGVASLEGTLASTRKRYRHAMLATDGVFSMDGDLAPLAALAALAERYDAWLLSDDAHGLGVVGAGRGSAYACGVSDRVPLQMGTLSKALGSYGGYLCADAPVVELMRNRARTLIYSTALPPAALAAALAALDIIEREPERVARPIQNAARFARRLGLAAATSAIVPVVIGDAGAALRAAQRLEDEGFLVVAIRPPTVAEGTARLRIAFTAAHCDEDVDRLADAVRRHALGG